MVPEGMTSDGINREHGADDPNGAKTVAAPATVSGLPDVLVVFVSNTMPLRSSSWEGRCQAHIREPGDLPSKQCPPSRTGLSGEEHHMMVFDVSRWRGPALFPSTNLMSVIQR
jgi:hypothetical protein